MSKKGSANFLQVDKGDNSRFVNHSLILATLPKIDINNAEQVMERSLLYFNECMEKDLKPTVAGYGLALGIDRGRLNDFVNGARQVNPDCREIMVTFHRALTAQMEDYMSNNKINPVAGIFLMRNNMGYSNDETLVVRAERNELVDQKALIEQANALPIEMNGD